MLKERQQEDHLFEGKDKFITSAYRRKLEEDKKWVEGQKQRCVLLTLLPFFGRATPCFSLFKNKQVVQRQSNPLLSPFRRQTKQGVQGEKLNTQFFDKDVPTNASMESAFCTCTSSTE
jgi:hypothetical protein